MKKYILRSVIAMILFYYGHAINAQPDANFTDSFSLKELTVGDMLPDLLLDSIDNYSVSSISMSAFRGKVVILEFWASWCGACLGSLPKTELKQEKWKDSIQFFMINTESSFIVNKYIDNGKSKSRFKGSLPRVRQNKILEQLFNPQSFPHYIWINAEGKIIGITDSGQLTDQNLQAAIRGEDSEMKVKTEPQLPWDYRYPLFVKGNGGDGEHVVEQSVLSGYVEGLPSGSWVSYDYKSGYTVLATNLTIKSLYQIAYNTDSSRELVSLGLPDSRTKVFNKDSIKINAITNGKYDKEKTYTYQLITSQRSYKGMMKIMQADLKRYFGYPVTIEKKRTHCYVLRSTDTSKLVSISQKPVISRDEEKGLVLQNISMGWLRRVLMPYFDGTAILDETGFKGQLDIIIEAKLSDRHAIIAGMGEHKLFVVREFRSTDILIIK